MKLGLGTVQFGQKYGISNLRGITPQEEAHAVIRRAAVAGITVLDTAPRYGDAERVLGNLGPELQSLRIVTKTPEYDNSKNYGLQVSEGLHASLATLGLTQIYGLLEHRTSILLGNNGDDVWRALYEERDMGRVTRIGASVYSAEELDAVLDRFAIDLVQFPANVLDRRMLKGDRLARLADRGVEIHIRSAFLQGSLLASPKTFSQMPGLCKFVSAFQSACAAQGCSPLEGALGFLQGFSEIDVVLVGVENIAQLDQILAAKSSTIDAEPFTECESDDPMIVDPSRWEAKS